MPLTIRAAVPTDIPTIVEFNCRLATETEGKTLDREIVTKGVTAALSDPHKGPYFVAEEYGQILGVSQITFEWSDWRNGWYWWLQSVYVRADSRGKGVFRALYDHICRLAKQDPGVLGLRLYVEIDNLDAQQTYRKLGMNRIDFLIFQRSPI